MTRYVLIAGVIELPTAVKGKTIPLSLSLPFLLTLGFYPEPGRGENSAGTGRKGKRYYGTTSMLVVRMTS